MAKVDEAAAIIEETLPGAFKGDSHALLMTIYKDTSLDMQIRLDAAKAAIGYEKPRLAATELSGSLSIIKHEEALDELDE